MEIAAFDVLNDNSQCVLTWSPAALRGGIADLMNQCDLRIVITGASGWLGMATLEMLHGVFGSSLHDRVACFGSQTKKLLLRTGPEIIQKPLSEMAELSGSPTLLLHYAFLTREKISQIPLSDYVSTNRGVSEFVATQADRLSVHAAVVVSSGAVYDKNRSISCDVVSNPYGALKIEEEERFSRWAEQKKGVLVVPRLFNLSGPYMNKHPEYALSSLILDCLHHRPMTIQASHPVIRSYTGVEELVSICMAICMHVRESVHHFDTAGEEEIEIGDLAEEIVRALQVKTEIVRPPIGNSISDRYVGDGVAYRNWGKRFRVETDPIDRQVVNTAAFLSACPGL